MQRTRENEAPVVNIMPGIECWRKGKGCSVASSGFKNSVGMGYASMEQHLEQST